VLDPVRRAADALRSERSALDDAQRSVNARVLRLEADLAARTAPLTGSTTVHQAWRRHPGVQAVFARRHLPACDGCAVGIDETLAEAALGHGFDLDQLLAELRAVLSDQPGALAG
jgi:hybrid cluster-associated redox disulfide protein